MGLERVDRRPGEQIPVLRDCMAVMRTNIEDVSDLRSEQRDLVGEGIPRRVATRSLIGDVFDLRLE